MPLPWNLVQHTYLPTLVSRGAMAARMQNALRDYLAMGEGELRVLLRRRQAVVRELEDRLAYATRAGVFYPPRLQVLIPLRRTARAAVFHAGLPQTIMEEILEMLIGPVYFEWLPAPPEADFDTYFHPRLVTRVWVVTQAVNEVRRVVGVMEPRALGWRDTYLEILEWYRQ